MNTVTAWSYSRYNAYETCPLAFKLRYLDKTPEPPSPAMERGNKVHKAIAEFLDEKAAEPPPEATKIARCGTLLSEVKAFPDKLVEHQQGFTKTWEPTGWFGAKTWYRQVYDVALLYEDLTAEAVDWKTGKRYSSNAEQMELQALSLLCQFKPATHVTTRLVYLDTGEEEFAEFPASDKGLLRDKWNAKVVPMFSDTTFAPRPNDKCKWCHFSRSNTGLCRFG